MCYLERRPTSSILNDDNRRGHFFYKKKNRSLIDHQFNFYTFFSILQSGRWESTRNEETGIPPQFDTSFQTRDHPLLRFRARPSQARWWDVLQFKDFLKVAQRSRTKYRSFLSLFLFVKWLKLTPLSLFFRFRDRSRQTRWWAAQMKLYWFELIFLHSHLFRFFRTLSYPFCWSLLINWQRNSYAVTSLYFCDFFRQWWGSWIPCSSDSSAQHLLIFSCNLPEAYAARLSLCTNQCPRLYACALFLYSPPETHRNFQSAIH